MRRVLLSFACGTLTVSALLIMSILFDTRNADDPAWADNHFQWLIIWPTRALFRILYPEHEFISFTRLGSVAALCLGVAVYSVIVYALTISISSRNSRYP